MCVCVCCICYRNKICYVRLRYNGRVQQPNGKPLKDDGDGLSCPIQEERDQEGRPGGRLKDIYESGSWAMVARVSDWREATRYCDRLLAAGCCLWAGHREAGQQGQQGWGQKINPDDMGYGP